MSVSTVNFSEANDSNTLYFILGLQILLVIERVFSNVFKRIKRCQCSDCCTMNMGDSNDVTPQRVPTIVDVSTITPNPTPNQSRERRDIESVSSEYD